MPPMSLQAVTRCVSTPASFGSARMEISNELPLRYLGRMLAREVGVLLPLTRFRRLGVRFGGQAAVLLPVARLNSSRRGKPCVKRVRSARRPNRARQRQPSSPSKSGQDRGRA